MSKLAKTTRVKTEWFEWCSLKGFASWGMEPTGLDVVAEDHHAGIFGILCRAGDMKRCIISVDSMGVIKVKKL